MSMNTERFLHPVPAVDPNARFLSAGAAFAAQRGEEERLLRMIEQRLALLAETARAGVLSYSLSRASLQRQWEADVEDMIGELGLPGAAAQSLKDALVELDAGGELFALADGVMRYGLASGSGRTEVLAALDEVLESTSLALTASGGLWDRIKGWVAPRSRKWRTKARTMARTAYTGYSGLLAQEWLAANGHATKRWVTRHDDAVRTTHRAADGQVVPVQGRFQVGGALLAYPGERTGPPGETINCRCVIISGDT